MFELSIHVPSLIAGGIFGMVILIVLLAIASAND